MMSLVGFLLLMDKIEMNFSERTKQCQECQDCQDALARQSSVIDTMRSLESLSIQHNGKYGGRALV